MTVRLGGRGLPASLLLSAGVAAVAGLAAAGGAAAAPAHDAPAAAAAAVPADAAALRPQREERAGAMRATATVTPTAVTASAGLRDAVGDGPPAPDLISMVAFTDDDGRYSVGIELDTNALIEGDMVATFVNTDGNAATGEPVFGGADLAVTIVGRTGTDLVGAQRWNGWAWQPVDLASLISFASGTTDEVWSVSAAEAGIAPGTTTTLVFATMYEGLYDDWFDFAPEPGAGTLPFTVPGAVAAPAPAGPSQSGAGRAAVGLPSAAPARPLAIRRFALSRAPAGVRARIAWRDGAGAVRWTLRLSARVGGRAVARTVRGAGAPGARTVLRTVPLPRAWAGARVRARLELRDASRRLVRTASVRA